MEILEYGEEVKLRKNTIIETGNTYGQLTVIAPARIKGKKKVYWHCKCSCGKENYFDGCELRQGKRTSCGNNCNNIIELENNKIYHYLKILKKDDIPGKFFADKCTHWICECQLCGTIKSISGKAIRSGETKSCGCLESYGERLVAKALQELNLKYEKEYTFPDLIGKNNNKYRFDFAIFNNDKIQFIIEFNGCQHFKETMKNYGSSLEERQERDEIKKQYCVDNHINILNFNSYGNHKFEGTYEEILDEIKDFYNLTLEEKNYVKVSDYNFGNL